MEMVLEKKSAVVIQSTINTIKLWNLNMSVFEYLKVILKNTNYTF